MKITNIDTKDNILNMTFLIEETEFGEARKKAYIDHTDIYPVVGVAPGMATLDDLEATYGPAVLFDEALSTAIPQAFQEALTEQQLRIMGKPEVLDVRFEKDRAVQVNIKANLYPKVKIGQYKGIAVPFNRSKQQEEFERAVIQKACENMEGSIPIHMVEDKLDSMLAQTKVDVNGDAVYHLLADMLYLLEGAYQLTGVSRPKSQVRSEAMDLMLQIASAEHEMDWKTFFKEQVTLMVERYHDLPDDFDEQLTALIQKREKSKAEFTPEEVTEEVFKAYLGSLDVTEEQWKKQRTTQAAKEVCLDLLLDQVSEIEDLRVSQDEVHHFIEEIAEQCAMEPEEVEANINKEPLIWKLKRDKALALILDSAVTDE